MINSFGYLFAATLFLFGFSAEAKTPLFNNDACHPVITKSCALYFFTAPEGDQGLIPYAVAVQYYQQMSSGLITTNPEQVRLQDSKYRDLADQNREHLSFFFDTYKMTLAPVQDLSAETMDKLFGFDATLFKQKMNATTFNGAMKNYYLATRFNRWALRFDRDILIPTDWKSLIHPPVFSLAQIDETPASGRTPASNKSFWEKDYHTTLDSETRTELTQGNEMRLFVNNPSYFEKIRMIKEAKRFVFLAVMSFAYTDEGQKIIDALIEKAQEGKDVRVIMEKVWGKIAFNKTIKKLRKGGVKVALANDFLRPNNAHQGLFHSKYIVIDGERGTVGGQNLVDRSAKGTGYNHFNKDTDVHVSGPVLTDMMEDYIKLWEHFTRQTFPIEYKKEVLAKKEEQRAQKVRGTENYADWLQGQSPGLCRFVSQGPNEDKYKISKAYFETFSRAQNEIYMTTQIVNFQKHPIFKTNWITRIYRKIFEKARSGIPVHLVTNGIDGGFLKTYAKSDSPFEKYFKNGMNNISGYLNTAARRKKIEIAGSVPNMEIWQHFQYIHSKVAVVDDTVTAVGSYNFETYSAEHSYETAVFCQDRGFVNSLEDDLNLTMANSTPLKLGN